MPLLLERDYRRCKSALVENLPWIHDPIRIERLLDGAEITDFGLVTGVVQVRFLGQADPVLSRNTAAVAL